MVISDKFKLLGESSDESDEDEDSSASSAKSAIDAILGKTDAAVAQCRNQLPSPSLEGGAFHFVDASAPDNAVKGWCTCMSFSYLSRKFRFWYSQSYQL